MPRIGGLRNKTAPQRESSLVLGLMWNLLGLFKKWVPSIGSKEPDERCGSLRMSYARDPTRNPYTHGTLAGAERKSWQAEKR